jgi:hypothetical protein
MSPEHVLQQIDSYLESADYESCLGIKFKTPGVFTYDGQQVELDEYDRKKLRANVEKYIKIYLNSLGCCDTESE